MKFSIVVPTLNEEKHIEQCLQAINNQNYDRNELEVIVVDGNSSDATLKIAKKHADKVVVEKKRGIARARNMGASYAQGSIIVFIDCDTIISSDVLQKFEDTFSDASVSCSTVFLRPNPNKFRYLTSVFVLNKITPTSSKLGKMLASTMCIACRRESFDQIGGFNERLSSGEDIDLSIRLSRVGKTSFIKNTSATTSMRRLEEWGIAYFLYRYFRGYLKGKIKNSQDFYEPVRI